MKDIKASFTDNFPKNIKALFVDCDSVLYDNQECTNTDIAITGLNKSLAEYHLSRKELDQVRTDLKKKGIRGMFNAIRVLCSNHGIPFDDFSKTMVSKIDYSRISPDNEMLKLLKLVGKKIPIYIVTNNIRPHLEKIFDCLRGGIHTPDTQKELNIIFVTIEDTLTNGVFQSKKMDGQFINLCQQRRLQPHEVLLLDDSQSVLDAALEQGLSVAPIQCPTDTKQILRRILERTENKRCLPLRKTCGGIGD